MNEIKISFDTTVYYQYVTWYISKFCADSITKIHISGFSLEIGLKYFTQPFTRIENVSLELFPEYTDLFESLYGISIEKMSNSRKDWQIRFFP